MSKGIQYVISRERLNELLETLKTTEAVIQYINETSSLRWTVTGLRIVEGEHNNGRKSN